MRTIASIACIVAALLLAPFAATASDFDWMDSFNVQAQADPTGFRAGLATRFHVGDAEIGIVLGDLTNPADAYMVFRLGEMSKLPFATVVREYKSSRGKGWGVLAQRLGIKPGSPEFHALKKGHDLTFAGKKDKGKTAVTEKANDRDKLDDKDKNKEKKK